MMTPRTEISQLKKNWESTVDGLQIISTQTQSEFILHLLYVPVTKRNQGYGDEIMNDITNYCDKHNLVLKLAPVEDYGIPIEVLTHFYGKHGLSLNKDGTMSREPLYWSEFENIAYNHDSKPKINV